MVQSSAPLQAIDTMIDSVREMASTLPELDNQQVLEAAQEMGRLATKALVLQSRVAAVEHYSPREQVIIRQLERNPREKFSRRDLISLIDDPLSPQAKKYVSALLLKLETDEDYSDIFKKYGKTSGQHYWIQVEGPTQQPSRLEPPASSKPPALRPRQLKPPAYHAPKPVSPKQPPVRPVIPLKTVLAPTKPETTVVAEAPRLPLTDWGLEVSQDQQQHLYINGQPLSLRSLTVDAVRELIRHENGLNFERLLAELSGQRNRQIEPTTLGTSLLELKEAFEASLGGVFSDEIVGEDDDINRIISVGGVLNKATEVWDSLAPPSLPSIVGPINSSPPVTRLSIVPSTVPPRHIPEEISSGVPSAARDNRPLPDKEDVLPERHNRPRSAELQWQEQAACKNNDVSMFYAHENREISIVSAAKRICLTCEVKNECLTDAMEQERGNAIVSRHGIWGGLTPSERVSLARLTVRRDISADVLAGRIEDARNNILGVTEAKQA